MAESFLSTLNKTLSVKDTVDFRTFVCGEDYLNLTGVYEYWLSNLTPRLSRKTSRAIFRGSTGAGKSTVMNLVLLYKIYLLFMQGSDVAKTLGLMKGTDVYCFYFSVSMTQAKRSGFNQLKSFIDGSSWFNRNFPRDKSIDSSIRFPNKFYIEYASGEQHQISLNIWGFILDEANFRKTGSAGEGSTADFDEVYHLANQLETRLSQRFLRDGIENFFAGYISSASYETAFIQDKGDDYKDDPNAIVLDPVLYKVDPRRYTKNRFEVFFGFGEVSPCIVEDEAHKETLIRSLRQMSLPDDKIETFFEKVPLELQKQFRNNIYLAIQNICGRPTALRGSFVTNYEIIKNSYDSTLLSPFSQDSVTVSNKVDLPVEKLLAIDPGNFLYPTRPHSLFMDISLQGDYGSLSCVRYDGMFGGVKYHSHVFTLEFIPPAFPAATDLTKVQNFIIWLAQYINVAAFGSDNFNSVQIRQEVVKALDIPDVRVSLDSTDLPHLAWLSACVSSRFKMHFYERLDKEIREAVHDLKKRRVIKRKGSSDDQFQTVVGAFYLSDTIGSTTASIPERVNVVNARSAMKLAQSCGYTGGSPLDPTTLMSRLGTEDRLRERARAKFSKMLDEM